MELRKATNLGAVSLTNPFPGNCKESGIYLKTMVQCVFFSHFGAYRWG